MAVYTSIDNPEAYFQTVIYTGNGSANNAITLPGDTDMQPDLVWIKNRDATDSHCIFDSVRGVTKLLSSDNYNAEATDADTLDSFASDGFQVDADVKVNTNTEKYAAWCWKESATAGFDIVAYTGNGSAGLEVSHSLSAVPHFMIFKDRTDGTTNNWYVYQHKNTSAPEDLKIRLDTTHATSDDSTFLNDTAPTNSVFTLGDGGNVNTNTDTYIAYLWTEKQGFSKFGSYTGNENADGPFVYTGFRPAFVILKLASAGTENWYVFDSKRDTSNPLTQILYPNLNNAEVDGTTNIDFLSNGFKLRNAGDFLNDSGEDHIYMAFAEAPLVNSEGVPCNAR